MKNLKKIRKARGYTRAELAEKLGIDQVSYGRYERGEREPSIKKLFAIADALQVRVEALFGESEVGPRDIFIPVEATFTFPNEIMVSVDVRYCDFPLNQQKQLSNLLASVSKQFVQDYFNRHQVIADQIREMKTIYKSSQNDIDDYLSRCDEIEDIPPQKYQDKMLTLQDYLDDEEVIDPKDKEE